MDKRISIIIPALNEAVTIGATLKALQPMRVRGCEVIVVDGGSDDETLRIAKPLADKIMTSTRGRAAQMAVGADCASHPVLWFLHADTQVVPDADTYIHEALGAHDWGRFNITLSGCDLRFRLIENMINLRSCISGIATGDQGIFVRRQLYETIGGMPHLPLMEDVELSKRLRTYGRPACLRTRLTTSSRRWEQRGILRTILLMWWLRTAYALGVPAGRLAKWYR